MSEIQDNIPEESVKNEPSAEEIFTKELKKVNDFYLFTVIISAAVILAGLIYAVAVKVFIGLIVAIAGVLLYIALTSNILYKNLGLGHRSDNGSITITAVYGRNRREIYIPRRLLWCDVTEIGDRAFKHRSSADVTTVHLPSTLKRLGESIFEDCPNVKTIYFEGSAEEWEAVEKSTDLEGIEIVFPGAADGEKQTEEAGE